MSALLPDEYRSASDPDIIFYTMPEGVGVAQIRHDTLLEFRTICKELKITNNDGVNNITYRTQSPSAVLRTCPPNSEVVITEWTNYIEINPNAVTGSGLIEMDLVDSKEARKNKK